MRAQRSKVRAMRQFSNSIAHPRNTVEAKLQQAILNGDAAELRLALESAADISATDTAIAQRALTAIESIGQENAAALAQRYGVDWSNKVVHIFGNAEHNLSTLLGQAGSAEKAFLQLQNAVETAYSISKTIPASVTVGSQSITVRVTLVSGFLRISTAYIP